MSTLLQPYPGLAFKEVLVIRHGSSCVAAMPSEGVDSNIAAEELLANLREEHYAAQKQWYRDWDQYCSANNWWITRVPVVG